MNKLTKISIGVLAIVIALVSWSSFKNAPKTEASAQNGFYVRQATSSQETSKLEGGGAVIFASSTPAENTTDGSWCKSRTVTVNTSSTSAGIMLSFDSMSVNTGTFGQWQAASTTVTYDGGLYGCGLVRAYGNGITLTATEFR